MQKKWKLLACIGLVGGTMIFGNGSEARSFEHMPIQSVMEADSAVLLDSPGFNITITNNPNISNNVNVENNNENTNINSNENNNQNTNTNTNDNWNDNKNENKNDNKNENRNDNINANQNDNINTNKDDNIDENVVDRGHDPEGKVESLKSPKAGHLYVKGWAYDRDDMNAATRVQVYVGGTMGSGAENFELRADKPRTDVGKHGFEATQPVRATGQQMVHVYAINDVGGGETKEIGSQQVRIIPAAAGEATITHNYESGTITVSGWTNVSRIMVRIGNTTCPNYNISNPNYERKNFSQTYTIPSGYIGDQQVTVTAMDSADSSNKADIGNGTIFIIAGSATVSYDKNIGKILVNGWANTSHIRVKIDNVQQNPYQIGSSNHARKNFSNVKYDPPNGVTGNVQVIVEALDSSNMSYAKKIWTGSVNIVPPIPEITGTGNFEYQGDKKVRVWGSTNAEYVEVKIGGIKQNDIQLNNSTHVSKEFDDTYTLSEPLPDERLVTVTGCNSSNGARVQLKYGSIKPFDPEGTASPFSVSDYNVLHINGRAIDRDDTTQNVKVRIYAGNAHMDFDANEGDHNFEVDLGLGGEGRVHVKAEALNTIGGGRNVVLREDDVEIQKRPAPPQSPTGAFTDLLTVETGQVHIQDASGVVKDIAGIAENQIRVRGWSKDVNAPNSPLRVHIYVGGGSNSGAPNYEISTDANGNFDMSIRTDRTGAQEVYAYAIDNDGQAGNVEIGHRSIYIPWLGRASKEHLVYRVRSDGTAYNEKDDVGIPNGRRTGNEKVFANDEVIVFGEASGWYLIRYWSDTNHIYKDRWIPTNGGIVRR